MNILKSNQLKFGNVIATIKYKGEKENPYWSASSNQHHVVTIRNVKTRRTASFDYWASIAEPYVENRNGLKDALNCLGSDALSGDDTFEGFCGNFGYDQDSRKAEKIYKACVKTYNKLLVVGGEELIEDFNNIFE